MDQLISQMSPTDNIRGDIPRRIYSILFSTPQQCFRIMFVDDEKDILRVIKRDMESHETNHTDITYGRYLSG